jgi:hypothetical protein
MVETHIGVLLLDLSLLFGLFIFWQDFNFKCAFPLSWEPYLMRGYFRSEKLKWGIKENNLNIKGED